jgi:hypothetical protein
LDHLGQDQGVDRTGVLPVVRLAETVGRVGDGFQLDGDFFGIAVAVFVIIVSLVEGVVNLTAERIQIDRRLSVGLNRQLEQAGQIRLAFLPGCDWPTCRRAGPWYGSCPAY